MRLNRRVREWLWFVAVFAAYILLATLIGVVIARAEPAKGCAPPDPRARPIVKLSRGELRALAALAWAEARGEPDAYCSMLAVSSVVINRMKINPQYFGATITQVINRPYAFSPFGKDDPNKTRMGKVDESDPLFVASLLAAISAVSGVDNTFGATHFHSGKPPRWAANMLVTRKISGHTFLKSR
jgi:spore germination cell wall hydrolase CwlJ-like protein